MEHYPRGSFSSEEDDMDILKLEMASINLKPSEEIKESKEEMLVREELMN